MVQWIRRSLSLDRELSGLPLFILLLVLPIGNAVTWQRFGDEHLWRYYMAELSISFLFFFKFSSALLPSPKWFGAG